MDEWNSEHCKVQHAETKGFLPILLYSGDGDSGDEPENGENSSGGLQGSNNSHDSEVNQNQPDDIQPSSSGISFSQESSGSQASETQDEPQQKRPKNTQSLDKESPGGFKYKWLKKYKWLRFNEDTELMTCDPCCRHRDRIKKTSNVPKNFEAKKPSSAFIAGTRNFNPSTLKEHSEVKAYIRIFSKDRICNKYQLHVLMFSITFKKFQ